MDMGDRRMEMDRDGIFIFERTEKNKTESECFNSPKVIYQ